VESFLEGLGLLVGGGLLALVLAWLGRDRLAIAFAVLAVLAALGLSAGPTLGVLLGGEPLARSWPWSLPGGALSFRLDPLAAFFLLTILVLASASAIYGAGYLEHEIGRRPLGPVILFFNVLVAALCLVATAANAVLFLVAWEVMTVSAFLLVSFEHEKEDVRRAALLYLTLSHVATAFLVAFFLLLGREAGSLDFDRIAAGPRLSPGLSHLLFAFAIVGFGTKAGIWPLHVWLPEAHPAAPTHVSAVMSGVIVKTALYALVRGVTLLGPPHSAWGFTILLLGAVSGIVGVLYALAQHDLKRLLAYHTIENVGIILLGVGTGFLGLALGKKEVALLGFAGGLLHVLNHGIFKSLLFYGAGAVLRATHTRDLERLGGLGRLMPWTAATFLVASVAICGLPPLNGFVSELLVYAGLFGGRCASEAEGRSPRPVRSARWPRSAASRQLASRRSSESPSSGALAPRRPLARPSARRACGPRWSSSRASAPRSGSGRTSRSASSSGRPWRSPPWGPGRARPSRGPR
jgi:formate hydrogenlyase subunit 3/multisubunit Na+/H+ antiporter MnhD subunit